MPVTAAKLPPATCRCGERIETDGIGEYLHSDTFLYACLDAEGKVSDNYATAASTRKRKTTRAHP